MQTVVETPPFQASAKKAGMSEAEVFQLIDYLAENPDAGDDIKGTGGCRKVRVADAARERVAVIA